MLRFILACVCIVFMLHITHENAYIGFGIWMYLYLSFMIHASDMVDYDEIQHERMLLRDPESRATLRVVRH
jgi:hypothetical protein